MGPDAIAILVVAGLLGTVGVVALWVIMREEAGCRGQTLRYVAGARFAVWALAVLAAGVRTLVG